MNKKVLSIFINAEKGTGGFHGVELRKKLIKKKYKSLNYISIKKNKIDFFKILFCIFSSHELFSITSLRYLGFNFNIINNKEFSTIYLHTLHLVWLSKLNPRKTYILSLENFDPDYFSELAKLSENLFQKIYYCIEIYFSKRIIKNLHKIDNLIIWPLTIKDSQKLLALNKKLKKLIQVKPHLLLTKNKKISKPKIKSLKVKLLFIGHGNHLANLEAVKFIQKLAIINDSLVFDIIGKGWNSQSINNKFENINYHGYIDEISTIISDNTFFIAPIFSGSGINMKIITAIEEEMYGFISRFSAEPFELTNMNLPKDKFIIIDGNKEEVWLETILNYTSVFQKKNKFF